MWGRAKGEVLTKTGTTRGKGHEVEVQGLPTVDVVTYILLVPQRTWPLSPSHWCQIPRRRRQESGGR